MMLFANQKVQYWWVPQTHQCATNVDCRLANWQVNEVNIVVKCSTRFPFHKTNPLEDLGKGNLLEHFTTTFTSLTCQSTSLQSAFVAHREPAYLASVRVLSSWAACCHLVNIQWAYCPIECMDLIRFSGCYNW